MVHPLARRMQVAMRSVLRFDLHMIASMAPMFAPVPVEMACWHSPGEASPDSPEGAGRFSRQDPPEMDVATRPPESPLTRQERRQWNILLRQLRLAPVVQARRGWGC
jgi:hypothetical protein